MLGAEAFVRLVAALILAPFADFAAESEFLLRHMRDAGDGAGFVPDAEAYEAQPAVTAARGADFISFRHHTFAAPKGPKSTALTECGPRFELKPYQIRLGTVDQAHAESVVVREETGERLLHRHSVDPAGDLEEARLVVVVR